MQIEVNLTLRRLKLFDRYSVKGIYPVAIGKPQTPTPTGFYHITRKIINPGGILGTRWMELSIPSDDGPYGIHGTTQPWSIGKAVSNGCIRMYNHHVEEVFDQVRIGTPVLIVKSQAADEMDWRPHPSQSYYLVRPGDTLWQISQRCGIPMETLLRFNHLSNPDRIYPGQKLIITHDKIY